MNSKFTCAVITITLLCSLSYDAFAQGATVTRLEERISKLEKRVTLLEQRLAAIQSPVTPDIQKSTGKSNWRSLDRGMSRSAVQNLLGEPLKVDVIGSSTYWYYSKEEWHSKVIFDDNGVNGWTEPE